MGNESYEFLQLLREDIPISYYQTGKLLPIFNPMIPYFASIQPIAKSIAYQVFNQLYTQKEGVLSAMDYEFKLIINWLEIIKNKCNLSLEGLRSYYRLEREKRFFSYAHFSLMFELITKCRDDGYNNILKNIQYSWNWYKSRFKKEKIKNANLRLSYSSPFGLYNSSYTAHNYQYLSKVNLMDSSYLNMTEEKFLCYFPNTAIFKHIMYSYNNVDSFYIQILFKEFTIQYNNALLKHWLFFDYFI